VLQSYETRRLKRANDIVRQSLRLGQVGQLENVGAVAARDAIFKLLPPSVMGKQLEAALARG
ncbi:MAG TPA: hypothetical protein VE338_10260, partial [Ktedonobacterales bacterium]|nr:hypothetical protein [Ktedonobacterales bacterium]